MKQPLVTIKTQLYIEGQEPGAVPSRGSMPLPTVDEVLAIHDQSVREMWHPDLVDVLVDEIRRLRHRIQLREMQDRAERDSEEIW